ISGNFFPVSTCMTENGTRPKNALRASQIITLESLPSDHSSATLRRRAWASRRMKILCDSSSSSRSMMVTPHQRRGEGVLDPQERTLFLHFRAFVVPNEQLPRVEFFST